MRCNWMGMIIFLCAVLTGWAQPKIYDCFLFFNELEILQMRMDELYDRVDKFVIVEAVESFRGRPKSLCFWENRHLFSRYADKIIYVPVYKRLTTDNPWKREAFHRNEIGRGLTGCQDEDIILISDVDEIVRADDLQQLIASVVEQKHEIVFCGHMMYRYFLNRFDRANTFWPGTAVTTYKVFKGTKAERIRRKRNNRHYLLLENRGWHFTSMGGAQVYITKLENWSHAEADCPEHKELSKIRRETSGQFLVEIDQTFPRYIREHQERLTRDGFIDLMSDIPVLQLKALWPKYSQLEEQNEPQNQLLEPYASAHHYPYDTSGWMDPRHVAFLDEYIHLHNVRTVVDVGAWLGLSTRTLALMLPAVGRVYAVDRWQGQVDPRSPCSYGFFLSNTIQAGLAHKIVPMQMSSQEAAEKLSVQPDLVYIDTVLDAEEIYVDILAWQAKLAPGGLLCGPHGDDPAVKAGTLRAAKELGKKIECSFGLWTLY